MISNDLDVSHVVRTNAGLCGLWQPERFVEVVSLDDFERELADEAALLRHIREGAFVPLNVGGDGSFTVAVRSSGLVQREFPHVLVSSEPYLLESRGSVELGGAGERWWVRRRLSAYWVGGGAIQSVGAPY